MPGDRHTVRLNKHLAESGLCSRREADALIAEGVVTVNGKPATVGMSIDPTRDHVKLRGKVLPAAGPKLYLLFYKPKGVVTTRRDELGRKTIYDVLPEEFHAANSAGRLDRDSSGALLLSNDGDFIHRVTHPSFHVPKVYRVTVSPLVTRKLVEGLLAGVPLEPEGAIARATRVQVVDPETLLLTLHTGYNRQIRRSVEALGHSVVRLKRTAIGPVTVQGMKAGDVRPLTPRERQLMGIPGKAVVRPSSEGSRGARPAGRPSQGHKHSSRPAGGPAKGSTRRP